MNEAITTAGDALRSAPIMVSAVIVVMIKIFRGIKIKEKGIPDCWLPLIAVVMGVVGYCFLTAWTPLDAMNGLVIGAAAVGIHQVGTEGLGEVKRRKKPTT